MTISATAAATGRSEFASSGPPFGRPKWASRIDLAALFRQFLDRGGDALDARRVGHAAVLDRHVEVDAQKDAFAGDVGVVERAEGLLMAAPLLFSEVFRIGPASIAAGAQSRRRIVLASTALEAQISLAIATAVSAMRFEKPHSLSYQDRTRTKVPSITLVWSRWKIDERSSWLKSIDTFGLSV